MNQVDDMLGADVEALLSNEDYGHLGCSDHDMPYVVPVHFVFDKPSIYIYTTEGKKQEIIFRNPKVCLQVENVKSDADWRSVVITGTAVKVTDPTERERAIGLLTRRNPTLSPAISIRWMDNWVRENREVVLRIDPSRMTGRRSVNLNIASASARPKFCGHDKIF